jgi:protease-4
MKTSLLLTCILVFFSFSALGKDIFQTGTSISHFYDARSVFTNPAALAYQTELNGSELLSSISYTNRNQTNDFALGLGLGSLGFGVETFHFGPESIQRYSIASSLSLGPWVFLGSRLGFNTSSPTLEGTTQIDLGLQVRPSPYFAFGFLANRLNRPRQNGVDLPVQYTFGATFNPLRSLLIAADLDTSTDNFGNDISYQSTASWELFNGFFISAGYDKLAKAHFGIQWDLGRTSVSTIARPDKAQQVAIAHAQFSNTPHRSTQPEVTALALTMDSSLSETGEEKSFFSSGADSFSEILYKIDRASQQPEIESVFLDIDSFPLGMGAAAELNDSLWKARKRGKNVHVALNNATLKEYLIASAAQSISLDPSGSIQLTGPKSERFYLKGTLDKIGIEANIVAKGAYKSAPETFNLKKASENSKKNIFENLDQAEKDIFNLVEKSGRFKLGDWKKIKKLALLSANEALQNKLIDKISHSSQAKDSLKEKYLLGESANLKSRRLSLPSRIALIVASGDIVREPVKLLGIMGSDQITPDKIEKQLKRAQSDPRVKGIVLRISSGGGDVLASHQIANQVKQAAKNKPIVVSMGDVAASGGYFMAAPAKKILASPLTLTGSIGVFAGKPSLAALYKKIDLKKEILSRSPYPGIYSEAENWTQPERDIIARQVNSYYDTFVNYVAENRGLSREKVEAVAQGRVWLGSPAKESKLVDQLGGVIDSIEEVRKLSNVDEFELTPFYPPAKLFDSLSQVAFLMNNTEIPYLLKVGMLSESSFLYWCPESLN